VFLGIKVLNSRCVFVDICGFVCYGYDNKSFLGEMGKYLLLLNVFFLFFSLSIYLKRIIKKKVIPHPFSWSVWAVASFIVGSAQLYSKAGDLAAYTLMLTAVGCLVVAIFSFKNFHVITISRWDIKIFLIAILACLIWLLTSSPLYAVILITFADVLSYYFTLRKAYDSPDKESNLYFYMAGFKFVPAILLIEELSVVNALYPVCMFIANTTVGLVISYRRSYLAKQILVLPPHA
jgi:hypothetical protein